MYNWVTPFKRIAYQIFFLIGCYFLFRIGFYLANFSAFNDLSINGFLRLCIYGLRFDLSAIAAINATYFLFFLLPLPLWRMPHWERVTQLLFLFCNILSFAFELSDWAYFPFSRKRSTNDVLDMIGRKGDFISLLPHLVIDYWFVPLLWIVFSVLLIVGNRFICRKTPLLKPSSSRPLTNFTFPLSGLIMTISLCLLAIRGGFQLIPINNGNALQVTESKFVPLVLNTPFSIMHSYSGKMEELNFFKNEELLHFYNPTKHYTGKTFQPKNVVVILLESFSKEYTGLGGRKSFTPFLDSLMHHSFVCQKGFANALHSAEGIPAVISGIPSLMDEPITTSTYGTDHFTSLPSELKTKGYHTTFYHGGTNGTMSFDIYAANAGFDQYFGRSQYNNEKDYDGNWGIWDEPFLQYFANGLNKMPEPFMATVFTLSSHDPFNVPEKYKNRLPKGQLPIQQTIAYTDLALRNFFETARHQKWFQNTLFVLTADHAAPSSNDPYYASLNMGAYAIPIVFYAPNDSSLKGTTDTICQQIDILPSVLDYLGYDRSFFSFGNSIFRPAYPRFVINELSGYYQWYMNGWLLTSSNFQNKALYHFDRDSLCKINLIQKEKYFADSSITPWFHAFVQWYRHALINNQLTSSIQ
ncbi:MAG: LTA synthase family protein [Bacteroidetes bacterium]|nr:LTA synthase family protein [Bacteroidota bacterium]MBS1739685.1 LTA synthase family protein [Bacteroidota bacterium]